jgi:hypothetical protein
VVVGVKTCRFFLQTAVLKPDKSRTLMLLNGYLPPSQQSVGFAEQQLLRQPPAARRWGYDETTCKPYRYRESGFIS